MNYKTIYDRLIANAFARPKLTGYTEKHHVLPRSLGGTDDTHNIAILTAKEHFVAHILLWKIYRNGQMAKAVYMMSKKSKYSHKKITGRIYKILKEEFSQRQTNQIVYKFENIKTGEIFNGTRKQFREYADITYSECATIVAKGFICHINDTFNLNGVNWKLFGVDITKRRPHNIDDTIYEFENIFTGQLFTGTRKEFDHISSYRSFEVIKNIRVANGWKLRGATPKRVPKTKQQIGPK